MADSGQLSTAVSACAASGEPSSMPAMRTMPKPSSSASKTSAASV
jgi:hypothetical protein